MCFVKAGLQVAWLSFGIFNQATPRTAKSSHALIDIRGKLLAWDYASAVKCVDEMGYVTLLRELHTHKK